MSLKAMILAAIGERAMRRDLYELKEIATAVLETSARNAMWPS